MSHNFEKHFALVKTDPELWQPYRTYRALDRTVLCAAQTRIHGAWVAYAMAVPGRNHEYEMEEVLLHGSKIPERVARALFPVFDGLPYDD